MLADREMAHNDAVTRCIDVVVPEGTMLNPRFPAASGFGNHLSDQICSVLMLALAEALPERVTAGWNPLLAAVVSGHNSRIGGQFVDILTNASKGGSGGTEGADGYDHIGLIASGGALAAQDPEVFELVNPHFLHKYEYLTDSAGPGRWRGGLGVETIFEFVDGGVQASVFGDGDTAESAAPGVLGGLAGMPNLIELTYPDGSVRRPRVKDLVTDIPAGTRWRQIAGGGGGYGEPRRRPADQVAQEVRNGYVSQHSAREDYGVVIDPKTGEVDADATADRRAAPPGPPSARRAEGLITPNGRMTSLLTPGERDRRWSALGAATADAGLEAIIVTSQDYRGHKGALRYVADYNLPHRYGYAVLVPGEEPTVVLPLSMEGCPRSGWISDHRFVASTAGGLCDVLRERGVTERVGVVGRDSVMYAGELAGLQDGLPGVRFTDATALFESVRGHKSAEEERGLEEASNIADACFADLLELARPGRTGRELLAELYRTSTLRGGEDALFLTMGGRRLPDGRTTITWQPPRDEELRAGELLCFSFELIGPSGYWIELARIVAVGRCDERHERMQAAVAAGLEAADRTLRPGATPSGVHQEITAAVARHGTRPGYWSGHGIGQDVIEAPWLGVEEAGEADPEQPAGEIAASMCFAVHPHLLLDDGLGAYMSDTYVVEEHRARRLSRWDRGLFVTEGGAR
jgi:Xaa-Pro aminopeptidase